MLTLFQALILEHTVSRTGKVFASEREKNSKIILGGDFKGFMKKI